MGRTWAAILRDAMRDQKVAQVHEATRLDPEGPIQRSTISNALNGVTPEPNARTLRVLCRVLNLDENAVRAELSRPQVSDRYVGPDKSRELTEHQRRLLDDLIDQMVSTTRAEAKGPNGPASGGSTPGAVPMMN